MPVERSSGRVEVRRSADGEGGRHGDGEAPGRRQGRRAESTLEARSKGPKGPTEWNPKAKTETRNDSPKVWRFGPKSLEEKKRHELRGIWPEALPLPAAELGHRVLETLGRLGALRWHTLGTDLSKGQQGSDQI